MPTSSLSDYQTYLRNNLPEYNFVGGSVPAPPGAIQVALSPMVPIKFKTGAAPFATVQPHTLSFTGTKRLGQLKHYKEKRDKITEYLASDCPRKDLVLKKYSMWNSFTVGLRASDVEDVAYQHLAVLKSDTAVANAGFAYYVRSVFGKTTPLQKKAAIQAYMTAHCRLHELVHFEHNNLFFIARKDSATGLGNGLNKNEGIFHFHSQQKGAWIDVQGIMLTSMSQLTAYCTDISGPLSNLWNEHKISAEVAKYTAIMEAAGFAGRDPFQKLVAEVEVDLKGGLAHTAMKGAKEAVFGKHCRTHPLRATRMALSKIFSVLPGIITKAGTALASAAATAITETATVASGVGTASAALVGGGAVPRWVQDAGLSPSEDELNATRWKEIQEHINSLEKWEERFGAMENKVRTERRTVVTCADMNEMLRCYAKIQFHLDKLVHAYEQELTGLAKVGTLVGETKLALAGFETVFKTKSVAYLNASRAQLITRPGGASVYTTGGAAYQRYKLADLATTDANLDTFLANNTELRSSAVDNDAAEIAAED